MQHDAQKRSVDLNSVVVINETQLPELVHEKIDAGPRSADHLRQHLLRNPGDDLEVNSRKPLEARKLQVILGVPENFAQ